MSDLDDVNAAPGGFLRENVDFEYNPPLILIVDDEKTLRLVLRHAMEKAGYRTAEAADGEQCLVLCQQMQPDLVLLDAMMPQLDGFTCCERLLALLGEECPTVLMITALHDPTSVNRALEVGATDYVTKPIDWPVLLMRVRRLLQTHWAMSQLQQQKAELIAVNAALHAEIAERQQAEERIQLSLQEKGVLLQEIHHRVKNNLQVIESLLRLQSRATKDRHVSEMFKESQNRIKSMALIHEKLYQSSDLARIHFADYIQSLAASLFRSYNTNSTAISLKTDIADASLSIDTVIPCGLIINELVSNSLKYAFLPNSSGEIHIQFQAENESEFRLTVSDNGVGFPKDLDFRNTESLGLQLVNSLAEQLGAKLELHSEEGTIFQLIFREK